MGREVRMVPANWQHPKYTENDATWPSQVGRYKPLIDQKYSDAAAEFLAMANKDGLKAAIDWMGCPEQDKYMPEWDDAERTHFMMYEDTSEGTPISPAFATPEELARWLADTGASSFGSMTATYEQWLYVAKGGFAPSAVFVDGQMKSGVEAMAEDD